MTRVYLALALLLCPAPLFAQIAPPTWREEYGTYVVVLGFILMVMVGGALISFFQYGKGKAQPRRPQPAPPPRPVYGSADFAQPYAGAPSQQYVYNGVFFGKSSMIGGEQALLDQHQGGPVCSDLGTHTLICARTRAGKGTRVIIPTLLRYMHNAVVIDPKGENAAVTARARASFPLNQKIHIINPWDELGDVFQQRGFPRATFNPLDIIDPNDKNAVAYAQSLARAICPLSTSGKDNFFNKSAGAILTAVFLWLADTPGESKTLARVRDIVTETKPEFQKYLARMAASEAFGGAIREGARPLIGMGNETYTSIMGTVAQFTDWLSDPQVKEATASSSFSMQDFMTHLSTIYLIVPTDKMDTQATWLRLMITAITQAYKHRPRSMQVHRCMFLIDEFPALQRIECIPADIAMLAGYGIFFTLVVQGLSDLRAVYHDDADRILNNCAYKWFCNVNDLNSAQYLSNSLGKMTVDTVTHGQSAGSGAPGHGSSSVSTNFGQTGRPLMMPDEIMTLGRETALLLVPNGKPHYLRTVDYWDLARAFEYLRPAFPQLFHDPPLIWDENPLLH